MNQSPRLSKRDIGKIGENMASFALTKEGYSILCHNYTCPGGEIDIIAAKENYICFVEVKLRSRTSGENAACAVDEKKMSRIRCAIEHFFDEYKDNIYVSSLTPRIDIVEIYTSKSVATDYNHIIGAD